MFLTGKMNESQWDVFGTFFFYPQLKMPFLFLHQKKKKVKICTIEYMWCNNINKNKKNNNNEKLSILNIVSRNLDYILN